MFLMACGHILVGYAQLPSGIAPRATRIT